MDSEILYLIFNAIREKKSVTLETVNKKKMLITEDNVIPIKVMISAQSGRQYLMAYAPRIKRIKSFRTDNIVSIKLKDKCERFDELQEQLKKMQPHIWGVSTQGSPGSRMEHVEFTIHYADDEKFIRRRLDREKRCGIVEHIDDNTSRFSVDVFDSSEVIPWIRTFICRIMDIQFSNKELENQFKKDIEDMNRLYGIGGDE